MITSKIKSLMFLVMDGQITKSDVEFPFSCSRVVYKLMPRLWPL